MLWFLIGGGILILILLIFLVLRNRMIASQNLVDAAFADIDAQLLKRHELIPKLVQVASGYAQHEAALLEELASKRSSIWSEKDEFPQILMKINAIKEAYPDLKADATFEKLMEQIKETENQLRYSRQFYNGTVEAYNRMIEQFPYSLFSKASGHNKRSYVAANEVQQQIPETHV